mmetsp:Transcript_1442/g.2136  ORF Transcript_1442/g.2136 Transcript_1442/m.2136 type:complete len:472 (+) Transcript_1442:109-1524(+)|eukprot:CAMPEP_0194224506 /NCGR_PEP_ID=MMETSP0156-20130528/37666_1 /TAXON_ID=33649 /ORGANISM="Thalassionema nitzschioides, Strain L26-B" /LENGTH=471 /DNA_ID=CAMNT_0038956111 /DNA_START=105 /DNA_END=1520 /DNA_ORIENTATION=-
MGLFKCCRSSHAVDEYAHVGAEKDGFDEDVKAVKWIRDRNVNPDLKLATTSENDLSSIREDPSIEPSRLSSDVSDVPASDSELILKDLLKASKQESNIEKSSKRQKRDEIRKRDELNVEKDKSLFPSIKLKESAKDSKRGSHRLRSPKDKREQATKYSSQSDQKGDERVFEEKISTIDSTVENLNESNIPPANDSVWDDTLSVYSVTSEGRGMEISLPGARKRKAEQQHLDEKNLPKERLIAKYTILEKVEEDDDSPYPVLGVSDNNADGLLRARLMEALRGFLPYAVSEENFWLKYRLSRDGASLLTLQESVRASQFTLLVMQAKGEEDCIFGCFTSTPWRRNSKWFGSGQAFLFKYSNGELGVYPFTDSDTLVQYCTTEMMAAGGGDYNKDGSPFGKGQKNGIGLLLNKNLEKGETYSCSTFCNPRLCSKNENEFAIDDLEAWALTPCMTENEAANLERHKLFVEKNRN